MKSSPLLPWSLVCILSGLLVWSHWDRISQIESSLGPRKTVQASIPNKVGPPQLEKASAIPHKVVKRSFKTSKKAKLSTLNNRKSKVRSYRSKFHHSFAKNTPKKAKRKKVISINFDDSQTPTRYPSGTLGAALQSADNDLQRQTRSYNQDI